MRFKLQSGLPAAALLGMLLSVSSPVAAQSFLVGAQLYSSGTTGATISAYQFSTNSSTNHAPFAFTGPSGSSAGLNASILLAPGDHVFTYSLPGFGSPGAFGGLNLLFNNTGVSFNPALSAIGIPGNLTAVAPTGGVGFSTPLAGTNVMAYNTSGSTVPATSYSGATVFNVGGNNLSIIGFTVDQVPAGTFTIRVTPAVTAAPEPATAALLAVSLLPLAGIAAAARRR